MRKKLSLLLVALMTVVTGAWAQATYTIYSNTSENVTFKVGDADYEGWSMSGVAEGTNVTLTPKVGYGFKTFEVMSNSYVAYGDSWPATQSGAVPYSIEHVKSYQKSEFVLPATDLLALKDKKISIMQFQPWNSGGDYWNLSAKVFLKEVESATISTFNGLADATIVYEGKLNDNMRIVFDTPFEYKGGNLLVGIYVTTPVSGNSWVYEGTNFRAKEVEGACISGYSDVSLDAITEGTQVGYLPTTRFYTTDAVAEVVVGDDGSRSFKMPAANQSVNYNVMRDINYKVNVILDQDVFYTDGNSVYVNPQITATDNFDEGNPKSITWFDNSFENADGATVANPLSAGKYTLILTRYDYAGEIRIPIEVIENYLIYNNSGWSDKVIFKAGDVEANAENGWPIIKKGDKISATPKEGYIFTQFDVKKNNADASVYTNWNSGYGPFDTNNLNAYQKNEMLYPAANLVNLIDKKISTINFQGYAYGDNLECKVFMKEVEAATITDFTDFAATDMVYEGLVNFNNGFTVALSTPYEYKGGNLLLGIYITKPSENAYAHFYYANYIEGAHISGYSTESLDAVEATAVNYVPGINFYTTENVAEVTEGEDGSRSIVMPAANQSMTYQVCRDMNVKVIAELSEAVHYIYGGGTVWNGFPDVTVYDALNADEENEPAAVGGWNYSVTYLDAEGNEVERWIDHKAGKYFAVVKGRNEYAGEIVLPFELFNAHWASNGSIAPSEYSTYYKDANLKVAPEFAELGVEIYAITEVGETAVTVEKVDVISANTPMLVFNGNKDNSYIQPLLIETDEAPANLAVAPEFKGSLTGEKFTLDEVNEFKFYIFNGVDFVRVNTAGEIGANRCWLQLAKSAAAAPRLQIGVADFGNLTGIDVAKAADVQNGQIYDMQGRKVTNAKKGLYILNGKKVVIK